MKNPIRSRLILSLLILIIVSSCGVKSEAEVVKDAKETTENIFHMEEVIEPNQTLKFLSLYLPERLDVTDEDESNIILKDGGQTYILFNNNLENKKSELNYQSAQHPDALLLESFQDADRFGYIRIMPQQDENYEMQVGIGGIKITTYTSKGKLNSDAEDLMKIVLSAQSN